MILIFVTDMVRDLRGSFDFKNLQIDIVSYGLCGIGYRVGHGCFWAGLYTFLLSVSGECEWKLKVNVIQVSWSSAALNDCHFVIAGDTI